MKIKMLAVAACALASSVSYAQQAPTTAAVIAAPTAPGAVLRAGTKISLKMAEELTTKGKKLRVGQRFQLEVAEDVRFNDAVVIPAGTPATGEITDVRNKGMWGKSGRIGGQLLYLRVNGRQIRLSGQLDDKGVTGTAGVVGAVAFVPVAGFFISGTSAKLPLGGAVTGFLDEDIQIEMAATPPAPLVVQVPVANTAAATEGAVPQPVSTPAKAD